MAAVRMGELLESLAPSYSPIREEIFQISVNAFPFSLKSGKLDDPFSFSFYLLVIISPGMCTLNSDVL